MRAPSTDDLLSIVGDIYDCALDPERWRSTLMRLNEVMNGAYTAISIINPRALQPRFVDHSPWDAAMIARLQSDYGPMEVPNAYEIMTGDLDTPVSSIAAMGEEALQRTRFYAEWAAPQGLRDGCGMKFVSLPERLGVLSLVTAQSRDPIGESERRLMALLGPHLRRAALIGDLLDYARVETSLLRAALAPLSVPVVLTDGGSRILHANDAAETLLSQGSVISSAEGCLALENAGMTAALSDAIARAAAGGIELGNRGIGIPASGVGAAAPAGLPARNRAERRARRQGVGPGEAGQTRCRGHRSGSLPRTPIRGWRRGDGQRPQGQGVRGAGAALRGCRRRWAQGCEGGVIFLSSAHLIKQPNHLTSGARMQPSEDDPRSAPIAYLEGYSAILRLASYAFLFLGTLTLLIGLSTVSDVREFVNANCVGDCIGSCFPYRNATSYAGFHLARSLLLIFCAVSLLVAARSHLRLHALGGIALGILSLGVAVAISVDRGC